MSVMPKDENNYTSDSNATIYSHVICPMANISIDYLNMSIEDFNGNKLLFVVVDTFTRFTELYPCKTIDGMSVVLALLQHIGRYNVPDLNS